MRTANTVRVAALLIMSAALALSSTHLSAHQEGQGTNNGPKNLQVLPKDMNLALVRQQMLTISKSLGVQCNFCHVVPTFEKDDKPEKQTARRMMKMVETINQDNFDGRNEVTCFTCHQGSSRPHSQLPADSGRGGGLN